MQVIEQYLTLVKDLPRTTNSKKKAACGVILRTRAGTQWALLHTAHTNTIYTIMGWRLGNTLPYFRISGSCLAQATGRNALPKLVLTYGKGAAGVSHIYCHTVYNSRLCIVKCCVVLCPTQVVVSYFPLINVAMHN